MKCANVAPPVYVYILECTLYKAYRRIHKSVESIATLSLDFCMATPILPMVRILLFMNVWTDLSIQAKALDCNRYVSRFTYQTTTTPIQPLLQG